jgi:DNA-binding LacI/PurR family transcriptional regulator
MIVDLCAGADGVYGARMTGAGFGGCAICLVREGFAEGVIARLNAGYHGKERREGHGLHLFHRRRGQGTTDRRSDSEQQGETMKRDDYPDSRVRARGSCGKKDEQAHTRTIGVALLTRGHIFYKDLEEGLRDEAARQHYELVVTSAEFDLGKQISQIEDFVARRVDAVIVCPVDSKGIGPGVRKANEANVPVFTADIAAQEGTVVSHIASDNVAGGRLAGEYIVKAFNGKGRIAIINNPVATSVLDRVQGSGRRSRISRNHRRRGRQRAGGPRQIARGDRGRSPGEPAA